MGKQDVMDWMSIGTINIRSIDKNPTRVLRLGGRCHDHKALIVISSSHVEMVTILCIFIRREVYPTRCDDIQRQFFVHLV